MKIAILLFGLIAIALAASRNAKTKDQVKIEPGRDDDEPTEVYIAGPNSNEIVTSSGAEVISMLVNKDDAKTPYVVLFHSGSTDGPAKKQVREMENSIREEMLAGHGDVKFIKVDASKKNYEDLTAAVGINTQELQESPSLLVMKGGKG